MSTVLVWSRDDYDIVILKVGVHIFTYQDPSFSADTIWQSLYQGLGAEIQSLTKDRKGPVEMKIERFHIEPDDLDVVTTFSVKAWIKKDKKDE